MKSFSKVLAVVLVMLGSLGLMSGKSWADATRSSVNTFLPAADASPYLTIYGSQTIQPWRYQFGAYFNYAKDPLEIGVGGATQTKVVNYLIMADVFGSLGITNWMDIGVNVPVAIIDNLNNLGVGAFQSKTRMGDVRLEAKFRLLDIDRYNFGISVLPYVLFPTGSETQLTGNGAFAGGGKVIFDGKFFDRLQMALNVGYLVRNKAVVVSTLQDDQFTYGLGASVKTFKWMDVMAEVYGSTNTSNFFGRQAEVPLEVDAGLRFFPSKPEGLGITVGGGVGLTFGYGTPNYRLIAGLSYPNPKRVDLPPPPPPPPPPTPVVERKKDKIVITKKIHFEFDKSVIRPISFPILDAVVDVLKENSDITKVRIEGHTDSKGTDAYNMKLSQRRANAVREYLISHGISADRLVAIGYGETKPVADNTDAEGRAQNRRVEFTILEQQGAE